MIGSSRSPHVGSAAIVALCAIALVSSACQTTSGDGASGDDAAMPTSPSSEFEDASVADRNASATLGAARSGFDLGTVYFDFDAATVQPDAQRMLADLGTDLRRQQRAVVIEGHADAVGSDEYNLALGERRAEAVRRFLFNTGVPAQQMSTVSFGESSPAVEGTGENVWRLNRRVEIRARE